MLGIRKREWNAMNEADDEGYKYLGVLQDAVLKNREIKAIGGGLTIFLGQKIFLAYQKLEFCTVQTLFTEWKKKIVVQSYERSKLGPFPPNRPFIRLL